MRWVVAVALVAGLIGCGGDRCPEEAKRESASWNAIICTPGAVVERRGGSLYCRCPTPQPTDEGKDNRCTPNP